MKHCRGIFAGNEVTQPDGASPDLAVLVSYSGDGGVERVINCLVRGFLDAGLRVDVLVLRRRGGHYRALPHRARVVPLWPSHSAFAVPALASYLRRVQPPVLLAAKDRAGRAALRAQAWVGGHTRVYLSIGNTLSQVLAGRGWLRRSLGYGLIRRLYPRADGVIAASRGVAEDVSAICKLDPARVHVVSNPVITPALPEQAAEPAEHPWLNDGGAPVVLGVGRLLPQKDFPTLLRAFAIVRAQRPLRLLILGEGRERTALERLVRELNLDRDVALPGFTNNPYAEMARGSLFVLSSAWEGFGLVVVEALAVGLPVVATDCRSGPREILHDGEHGALVPVGDAPAMARAMIAALDNPPPPERQRAAAAFYTQERSVRRHLDIFGMHEGASRSC